MSNKLIDVIFICVLIIFSFHRAAFAQEINEKDAEVLIVAALKGDGFPVHSPHFSLDKEEKPVYENAYRFSVYFATKSSLQFDGTYVVNRKNGVVWKEGSCNMPSSNEFKNARIRILNKYNLLNSTKKITIPCDR